MITNRLRRTALAFGLYLVPAGFALAQEGDRPRGDRDRPPEARSEAAEAARRRAEARRGQIDEQRERLEAMRRQMEAMQRGLPGQMRGFPFDMRGRFDPGRMTFGLDAPESAETGLGLTLRPVPGVLRAHLDLPEEGGLVVDAVADGSPASGVVEKNDILLKIGETTIVEASDVEQAIAAAEGDTISLSLLRKGEPQTVEVTLPRDAPAEGERYILGVTIETPDEAVRSQLGLPEGQGVIVMEVAPDSAAAKAGLKPNDLLIKIDGEPIVGAQELAEQVQKSNGEEVELTILRDGVEMTVAATPLKQPAPPLPPGPPRTPGGLRFFGPGVMIDPETGAVRPGPRGALTPEALRELLPPTVLPELEGQIADILEQLKQLREELEGLKQDRPERPERPDRPGRRGRDGA